MDQGLVKNLTPLSRSSECLTQCKVDNYELAMIVEGKNKTFNCTCIQRDFYKFTMQDFSSYCTDVSTYNLHTSISNHFIGSMICSQLPGRLFSPSDICKKLSHHFLLHFSIGMGSYDHHAKYQGVFP